ncbi:MAG: LamG-like jellyroll fold domain-containing protein [Bacteroidota bacterium]
MFNGLQAQNFGISPASYTGCGPVTLCSYGKTNGTFTGGTWQTGPYSWTKDSDPAGSLGTSQCITATTSGTYKVTINAVTVSCVVNITTTAVPTTPVITTTGSGTTFCSGGSSTLTAASSQAVIATGIGGNMLNLNLQLSNSPDNTQTISVSTPVAAAQQCTDGFTWEALIAKESGNAHSLFMWGQSTGAVRSSTNDPHMLLRYNGTNWEIRYGTGSSNTSLTQALAAPTLASDTRYHLAVTLTATTMLVYVNGVLRNTITMPSNMLPSALTSNPAYPFKQFYTAAPPKTGTNAGSGYRGFMDEVRVWNVVRTAQQISDNQYLTVDPSSTGLLAYYKFNEPITETGTTVTNYAATGTTYNGTLTATSTGAGVTRESLLSDNNTTQYITSMFTGLNEVYYSWKKTGGDGSVLSTTNSLTVSPTSTSTYSVTATGASGCQNVNTQTLTIASPPSISQSPTSTASCPGLPVNFTVTASGTGLSYAWQVSTNNGSSFTTLTDGGGYSGTTTATLNIGSVTAEMAGNQYRAVVSGTCSPAATSTAATLSASSGGAADVSITTSTPMAYCYGNTATFTATPTFGGDSPTYQWRINGNNSGAATSSNTFSTAALVNGDVVTVFMTSNAPCATSFTKTSNGISPTVYPYGDPISVTVSTVQSAACPGVSTTYVANPTNPGTAPTYQWKVNGSNISGATSATYTSSAHTTGQAITVDMTTNTPCTFPSSTVSSGNNVTVLASALPATVRITSNVVCPGGSAVYTAKYTNGGGSPSFQWKKNNVNVGSLTTDSTYTDASPVQNDQISVIITPSTNCSSPVTATAYTLTEVNSVPAVTLGPLADTVICNGSSFNLSAFPSGTAGRQLTFASSTGGTNYLVMPDSLNAKMTAGFTWEGWVKFTSLTTKQPIFLFGYNSSPTAISPQNGNYFLLRAETNGSLSIAANPSTYDHQNFAPAGTVKAGVYYHIAVTLDGTTMKVYFNGAPGPIYQVASALFPSMLGTKVNGVGLSYNKLGKGLFEDSNTDPGFYGAMDEVRIWNIARTGLQIRQNYQNSVAATTSGLLAYYKFDEATSSTSTVVTDATGKGNNANFSTNFTSSAPLPYVNSTVTPFNAYTYSWSASPGSSNFSTASSVSVSPTATTTYTLNLTAGSTGCSRTLTRTVTVNQALTINDQPNDIFVCTGASGTLHVGTLNGGTVTYNWQYRIDGSSPWVNATGAGYSGNTTATLTINTPAGTMNGYQYRAELTGCGHLAGSPLYSNTASLTIGSTEITTNPSSTSTCTNGAAVFTSAAAGTGLTYSWEVSTNNGSSWNTVSASSTYSGTTTASLTVTDPDISLSSNTYRVLVNGTCGNASSTAATLTVSLGGAASVTATSASGTTVCQGASVTFTASPVFGGSGPLYQWKKNGTSVGPPSSSTTYSTSGLANGDVVSVYMIGNSTCADPANAESEGLTMTVLGSGTTASVSITANAANACINTPVTFTAHPVNGGTTPAYQWKVNGTVVGTNSTYSTSSLTLGQVVTVEMSTSQPCTTPATAFSSNSYTVPANGAAATVTLNAVSACNGGNATYTASGTNGGSSPTYTWRKDNVIVQNSSSATYIDDSPVLGNSITVTLNSSNTCTAPVTSSAYTLTALTSAPAAAITASTNSLCAGNPVTLSAPATGPGNMLSFISSNNANVSNFVRLPNTLNSTMTTGFTFEGYISAASPFTTNIPIFTLGSTTDSSGTTANANNIYLKGESNGDISFFIRRGNTVTGFNSMAGSAVLLANTPVHIAITLDGTNVRFYKNGDLVFTGNTTVLPSLLGTGTGTVKNNYNLLGHTTDNDNTNGSGTFKGNMEEIRFWNVTRTQGQIKANYLQSIDAATSGLVAYYKFDSDAEATNESSTVVSSTGSNNGTLSTNYRLTTPLAFITSTFTSLNSITYSWSPAAGLSPSATSRTITATPAVTTTYTLTAVASTGCSTVSSQLVEVSGDGSPAPTVSISAANYCVGSPAVYTAVITNGGTGPSFVWKKNNVTRSTSQVYTDNTPAINDVITLSMTGGDGACTVPIAADPYTVTNVNLAVSSAITSSTSSMYAGDTATLSVPVGGAKNMIKFGTNTNDGNYIVLPKNINQTMTLAMTWEAYFRLDNLNATNYLFCLGSNPEAGGAVSHIQLFVETTGELSFGSYSITGNSTQNRPRFAPAGTIVANTTYHIAVTLDGANLKVYLNGNATPIYTSAVTVRPFILGSAVTDAHNFNTIGRGNATTATFRGQMDEVRLWSKARTGAEIHFGYSAPISTSTAGLVAYYKFDEATGTTSTSVTDASGNGNTGTLSPNFLTLTPSPYVESTVSTYNVLTYNWTPTTGLLNGSASATVLAAPTSTTRYTVVVSSAAGCSSTSSKTIVVSPRPTPTWTGAVSTDWNTAGNWQNLTVPASTDSAVIPFGPARKPILSGSATVHSLVVKAGGVLNIGSAASITIRGNILSNGDLNIADGATVFLKGNLTNTGNGRVTAGKLSTLTFNGTSAQSIFGNIYTKFGNVTVANTSAGRVNNLVGSTFIIGNVFTLPATGGFTNNGNTVLGSDAEGTARLAPRTNATDYSGTLTVQRYLPHSMIAVGQIGSNIMVGSPFSNSTVQTFEQPTSQMWGFPGANGGAGSLPGTSSVWLFDPNSNDVNGGWIKPTSITDAMPVGKGARIFYSGQFFNSGATSNITGTLPAALTYNIPLSYCTTGCYGGGEYGWNMIANPVPSPILWNSQNWTGRSDVDAAIYVWQQNNKRYSVYTYNPAIGESSAESINGGTGTIPSGQGFFVKALRAGSLSVTESVKATPSAPLTGFQRLAGSFRFTGLCRAPSGLNNEMVIGLRNDATNAYEPGMDAILLSSSTGVNMASRSSDGKALVINRLPIPEGTTEIQLYVKSAETGSHLLTFGAMEDLTDAGFSIILKDNYLGVTQELTETGNYSFRFTTDAATTAPDRFSLLISPSAVTGINTKPVSAKFSIVPNPSESGQATINLSGFKGNKVSISVTDAIGKLAASQVVNLTGGIAVEKLSGNLKAGMYTVTCLDGQTRLVQKIVIY